MKKILSLYICLMTLCCAARAQTQKLPSAIAKSLLGNSVRQTAAVPAQRALGVSAARQSAYLKSFGQAALDDLDDMLEGYCNLNVKVPPPEALRRHYQLQEQMVANWMKRDYAGFVLSDALREKVTMEAKVGRIDYTQYFPAGARLLALGEVHENDWAASQVEQAVYQYVRAYPERNVYYASEFIDAVPGRGPVYLLSGEQDVERLVRKRPFYRDMTRRLVRAGVRVVGLENPALSDELLKVGYKADFANTELAWKTISPAGMAERNSYWSGILRRIYAYDPDAVVFVHAGLGHTNYNHPGSLPLLLKEFKPFVAEFSPEGTQELNTLLERHMPLPWELRSAGRRMQRAAPGKHLQYVRFMKSKAAALVAGCDLNIRLAPPAE